MDWLSLNVDGYGLVLLWLHLGHANVHFSLQLLESDQPEFSLKCATVKRKQHAPQLWPFLE